VTAAVARAHDVGSGDQPAQVRRLARARVGGPSPLRRERQQVFRVVVIVGLTQLLLRDLRGGEEPLERRWRGPQRRIASDDLGVERIAVRAARQRRRGRARCREGHRAARERGRARISRAR
jgi:hypothetical protein